MKQTILILVFAAMAIAGCKRGIADRSSEVLVGPYPTDEDMKNLRDHKVELIVSLLDPGNPYEDTLLQREIAYAKTFEVEHVNYPVTVRGGTIESIHDSSVRVAADAIANSGKKVYLHAYHTMKRTSAVEDALKQRGLTVATYTIPRGQRSVVATQALNQAEAAYQASHFEEAIEVLRREPHPDIREKLLLGWSYYHLPNIPMAREYFEDVAATNKESQEALLGIAYCDYKDGDLNRSDSIFHLVLDRHPRDPSATAGMGLIRYAQGNYDEARDYLTRSLKVDSINVEAGTILLQIDSIQGRKRSTALAGNR